MRRTHTTLPLMNGESAVTVAAEAVRSLQETMRTYFHFIPGSARAGVDALTSTLTGRDKSQSQPSRTAGRAVG